jgi:hypothetical protein
MWRQNESVQEKIIIKEIKKSYTETEKEKRRERETESKTEKA